MKKKLIQEALWSTKQNLRSHELFEADLALKPLLLGVFAEMALHVILELEPLLTDRAPVLVGRVVLVHVVFEKVGALECLRADVTRVLVVVGQQVFHQVLLTRQILVAHHTFEE